MNLFLSACYKFLILIYKFVFIYFDGGCFTVFFYSVIRAIIAYGFQHKPWTFMYTNARAVAQMNTGGIINN